MRETIIIWTNRQTGRQTETDRQTDRDRQADRRTGRQTDRSGQVGRHDLLTTGRQKLIGYNTSGEEQQVRWRVAGDHAMSPSMSVSVPSSPPSPSPPLLSVTGSWDRCKHLEPRLSCRGASKGRGREGEDHQGHMYTYIMYM